MGGGDKYNEDSEVRTRSIHSENIFNDGYSNVGSSAQSSKEQGVHPKLNIKGKDRECLANADHPNPTAVFIDMDISRSRGKDVKTIFDKLPMFVGQIIMHNYVPHPTICFGAHGDAGYIDGINGDKAPIQVGQFESDNRLDDDLARMWLEEGGGGNGKESAELMAYFAARHTILDVNKRGRKGYYFISTDEGLYSKVSKILVKKWIGDDIPEDIDTAKIFEELQRKYHVFLIYQQKAWEDRVGDIDAEMKRRVEAAGGLFDDVDVRVTLLWGDLNDLDIHIEDPCGHHIYYGSFCRSHGRGPAACGGWLDVDMNVSGETTKPVENIRWAKGCAPKGHYRVFVRNYGFHERSHAGSKFKVEVQIGNDVQHFEGQMPDRITGEDSDCLVYEFDYDPEKIEQKPDKKDKYAAYNQETILNQWRALIPEENILICEDPKGIVDVMLGAMALTENEYRSQEEEKISLEDYLIDMEEKGQTSTRIAQTRRALTSVGERNNDLVDIAPIVTGKKQAKSKRI